MPWAKLDDKFHSHPKLQRAQGRANVVAGVYARSLSYCAAMGTDGFVDGFWAKSIAKPSDLRAVSECGLWVPAHAGESFTVTARRDSGRRHLPDVTVLCGSEGYFIEDFLHFNPSRDEVRRRAAGARADDAQSPDPTQPIPKTSSTKGFFEEHGWNDKQRREAFTEEARARACVNWALAQTDTVSVAARSYDMFKTGGWPPKTVPNSRTPQEPPTCEECGNLVRDGHTATCGVGLETERALAVLAKGA